jgi:HlyD family secretion protein
MDNETRSPSDVSGTLNLHGAAPATWTRWLKWAVIALLIVAALYLLFGRNHTKATTYVTQPVKRGDVTVTVTATGNLEPRNQVDIGSELSGTLRQVNVDVNDVVKAGEVLAVLDTSRLSAQVLQAQSSLQSAEARVLQSEASAKEARASYQRLLKVRELSGNKVPSQQDMDVAESTLASADADTAAAKAAVAQARASLDAVRTDLSKTKISSPINGVVLVRSVEVGQTVASSLQAPVLFTLAEDLKKMELHVSVDEADVGSVDVGQSATFTVDAFPNRRFSAHITQVHFASSNTQKSSSSSTSSASSATSTGVVTYETVLEVDNSDLLLRPGMTATAEIVTTSINDALLMPNAALRFTPEGQESGTAARPGANNGALSAIMPQMGRPRQPGSGQQGGGAGGGARRMGRAWILEDGKPVMVMFKPGVTDGRNTQVLPIESPPNFSRMPPEIAERMQKAAARKLEEGTQVIVDAATPVKK